MCHPSLSRHHRSVPAPSCGWVARPHRPTPHQMLYRRRRRPARRTPRTPPPPPLCQSLGRVACRRRRGLPSAALRRRRRTGVRKASSCAVARGARSYAPMARCSAGRAPRATAVNCGQHAWTARERHGSCAFGRSTCLGVDRCAASRGRHPTLRAWLRTQDTCTRREPMGSYGATRRWARRRRSRLTLGSPPRSRASRSSRWRVQGGPPTAARRVAARRCCCAARVAATCEPPSCRFVGKQPLATV